jgi:hypothetical protein
LLTVACLKLEKAWRRNQNVCAGIVADPVEHKVISAIGFMAILVFANSLFFILQVYF